MCQRKHSVLTKNFRIGRKQWKAVKNNIENEDLTECEGYLIE